MQKSFAKQDGKNASVQSHEKQTNPFTIEYGKYTSLRSDLFWVFLVKKTHKTKFLLVKNLEIGFSK